MSKMGISTVASYTGAQLFQVDRPVAGAGGRVFHRAEAASSAASAWTRSRPRSPLGTRIAYLDNRQERAHRELEVGGEYQWRREGEYHLFNPDTVFKLQHATRTGQYSIFKEYTKLVDDQSERLASLRGLFRFRTEDRNADPDRPGRARRRRSSSGSPPAR